MEKENKKILNLKDRRILIITIISIVCLLLLLTQSFALIMSSDSSDKEELYSTGSLVVKFDDTKGKEIVLDKAKPITDDYAIKTIEPYEFSIENTGSTIVTYNIALVNERITTANDVSESELKNNIKIQLNNRTPQVLSPTNNVIATGSLKSGESKTFNLRIWLRIEASSDLQNSSYRANVSVSGKAVNKYDKKENLVDVIKDAEKIINDKPNFTATSTDKGLFKINSKNKYYYRGAVDNNYVSFGTYKDTINNHNENDPILWRIVRINENNSITLISEDCVENEVSWSDSSTDYNGSNVESRLELWYTNTLSDTKLDSLIETTDFCNNKTTGGINRLNQEPPTPTLECSENDIIKRKIGLPTADEIVFSGMLYTTPSNTLSYLSSNSSFWTMTPINSSAGMFSVNKNYISDNGTSDKFGIRPVITLSSNVKIDEGNGSKTKPYKINIEN